MRHNRGNEIRPGDRTAMPKLSHRGICVSDLAASERFYCEALGFEPFQDFGVLEGPEMATTMQLPGVKLRARMLRRPEGPVIELLQFLQPCATGPREKRSTLQYGLVHISFYVDDIDAWAARITRAGGTVHEHTRAYFEGNDTTLLYCTDPDGTRVELMKSPGEAERFSHGGICVDDVEAAMRYYEALGFSAAENYVLDQGFDWLGVINEVPGIKLRAQMVRDQDGNTIELLKVIEPDSFGPRDRQPFNRFGLTHLAFWVDDPEATLADLAQRGGSFVPEAHVISHGIELFQGTDPNGVRIELMHARAGAD